MQDSHKAFEPLKTGQVADILGWSPKKTRKWLDGLARIDPGIVVCVNGKRRISLSSLRKIVPDFGKRLATDSDLAEVQFEQGIQKENLDEMARKFAEFRHKSNEWFRGLSQRMNAAEKAIREAQKNGPKRTE